MVNDQVFDADARATQPAIALLADETTVAELLNQPLWTDERIAAAVARLSADPSSSSIELLLESMRDDYEAQIAALKAHADDLALQLELAELDGPL